MSFKLSGLIFAVFVLGIGFAADGMTGFDAIQSLSMDTFRCLMSNGYNFFNARVYTSNGNIDHVGMDNIKAANAVGMLFVDAYLFPCLTTGCPYAATQVESVIHEMAAENLGITRLWLDIEKFHWTVDKAINQKFIREMVHQAQNMSMDVGIYTSYANWEEIVGLDFKEFRILPLWYMDYDGKPDFSGFRPFGGWDEAEIHQYQGNVNGPCGVRMDLNWFP